MLSIAHYQIGSSSVHLDRTMILRSNSGLQINTGTATIKPSVIAHSEITMAVPDKAIAVSPVVQLPHRLSFLRPSNIPLLHYLPTP